jgi:hypothetical protein
MADDIEEPDAPAPAPRNEDARNNEVPAEDEGTEAPTTAPATEEER